MTRKLQASLIILLTLSLFFASVSKPVAAATLSVPSQYPKIQTAIDASNDFDVVQVSPGTYLERLVVQKQITLQGLNQATTIIDGFGNGTVVYVAAPNVVVTGFTIRNGVKGVHMDFVNSGTISNNIITGNSEYGIRLFGSSNVQITGNTITSNFRGVSLGGRSTANTITNNVVSGSVFGIRLFNSTSNAVGTNTVYNNNEGISLSSRSDSNSLTGNTVSLNTQYGIRLFNVTGSTLNGNKLSNNFRGLDIFASGGTRLRSNTLTGTSSYNLGVDGNTLADFTEDIDTSNTVNSKPVFYLMNQNSITINPTTYPSIGYLGVVNSASVTIAGLTLASNIQGLLVAYTSQSTITSLAATGDFIGILLVGSAGNSLTGNTLTSNGRFGLFIRSSPNNILRSNMMTNNQFNFGVKALTQSDYSEDIDTTNLVNQKPVYYWVNQQNKQVPSNAGYVGIIGSTNITATNLDLTRNHAGVLLAYSSNSRITNLNASNDTIGVYLDHTTGTYVGSNRVLYNEDQGINLYYSTGNLVAYNNASITTGLGVIPLAEGILVQWQSSNNVLHANTVSMNNYGIMVSNSSINNMIDHNNFRANTVQAIQDASSSPTGWNDSHKRGNYWSDYKGVDLDGDGVGDTLVPHLGLDFYPLMNPVSENPASLKIMFELDWADYDNNGKVTITDIAVAAFVFDHPSLYWDLDLNGVLDITDFAIVAFHFDQSFPDLNSYMGKGVSPGAMDPAWKQLCLALPQPYKSYCQTRS